MLKSVDLESVQCVYWSSRVRCIMYTYFFVYALATLIFELNQVINTVLQYVFHQM